MRLFALLLIPASFLAAQTGTKSIVPLNVSHKVALVIGNSSYRYVPGVPPALNDADDIAATLKDLKFDLVDVRKDLTAEQMIQTVSRFTRTEVQAGDLALVYYSGHGGQVGEENYLLPIDYQPPSDDDLVDRRAYRMSLVRDALERTGARVRILIFDACRNSPLVTSKSAQSGLRGMEGRPEGTLIAYASAHNQVARFETGDRNSFYTGELLRTLHGENGDLKTLFEDVQRRVFERTNHEQTPYLYGFLSAPLYLRAETPNPGSLPQPDPAIEAWNTVKDTDRAALLETFLREFPGSPYAAVARVKIAALTNRDIQPGVQTPAPRSLPNASGSSIGLLFANGRRGMADLLKVYGATRGVFLSDVPPDGPAAKAGIKPEDILTDLDGHAINSGQDLVDAMGRTPVGTVVTVELIRHGSSIFATPTTVDRKTDFHTTPRVAIPADAFSPLPAPKAIRGLGAYVQTLRRQAGVLVASIDTKSFADGIGLMNGDVVVEMNRLPVRSVDELKKGYESLHTGDPVAVKILRKGALQQDDAPRWTEYYAGAMGESYSPTAAADKDEQDLLKRFFGENAQATSPPAVSNPPTSTSSSKDEEMQQFFRRFFGETLQKPGLITGLTVVGMSNEEIARLKLDAGGIRVFAVEAGSFAQDVGLRKGDVILEMNRRPTPGIVELRSMLSQVRKGETIAFKILRPMPGGSQTLYLSGIFPAQ